jgi:hypothetical protein
MSLKVVVGGPETRDAAFPSYAAQERVGVGETLQQKIRRSR